MSTSPNGLGHDNRALVSVGLLGYGLAGRHIHREPLQAAGLRIAAVATGNPQRQDQVRAELPGATIVPDLAALLAEPVDVIVIASPTGAHPADVRACIAAGRPMIVDKPMAMDATTARALVTEAESAGVAVTVFHNRRWDADQLTLASLLRQGRLGEVTRFERRFERFRPEPKLRWREQLSAADGGGLLLDLGSHLIDSAVQLFGPIHSVYAELAAHTTVAEDDAFLACRHSNGVVSHLGAHSIAGAPGPLLRVLGRSAAYVAGRLPGEPASPLAPADEPGCTGWLVSGEHSEPVPTAPGGWVDFYRGVPDWLHGDAAPPVDPWDHVHVLNVIDAARLSSSLGRVMPVSA